MVPYVSITNFFFFNDTATTEIYTLSLHDALPISAAVGSLIWLLLFNPSLGLLNYVLSLVGVRGPEWLIQPTIAIIAVSITTIWLTLGTNIIVLLAGLQGISEEIYEAVRLDGARGLRMFTDRKSTR